MERGRSKGFIKSIGDLINVTAANIAGGGITKAIEVSNERSESWQQDIAHAIIPPMSFPQSM